MKKGIKAKLLFIWVCQHSHAWASCPAVPNSTFQHHWSVPSINRQVCPQSIPISPPSQVHRLPPHYSFFIFHSGPLCFPLGSPPHNLRSWGVTPTKVICKQWLAEKSILYQQATKGFRLYDLGGKGLWASMAAPAQHPKLRCKDNQEKKRGMKGRGGGAGRGKAKVQEVQWVAV